MLGITAGFGGGLYLQQKLSEVQLPHLRHDSLRSFKLSIRVVAASVPALSEPGFWSLQRPRLEVTVGDARKQSELADFMVDQPSGPKVAGAFSEECPWRFGDILTFAINGPEDVLKVPGLHLCLRAQSDVVVGPVQLEFAHVPDLGEAAVDIRSRVLPACVRSKQLHGGIETWESPVLVFPLAHMRGGIVDVGSDLGQAVAHVALVFSLDVDPDVVLAQLSSSEAWPVTEVLASRADHVMKWLDAPIDWGVCSTSTSSHSRAARLCRGAANFEHAPCVTFACRDAGYFPGSSISDAPVRGEQWRSRSDSFGFVGSSPSLPPPPPPPPPRLPPAPPPPPPCQPRQFLSEATLAVVNFNKATEQTLATGRQTNSIMVTGRPPFGSIVSPNLPPEEWVSCKQHDGRTFWHNLSLGPAPWEALRSMQFVARPEMGGA